MAVASGHCGHGEQLIVFTRYPQSGQVKTRLIPALGPERAADLQREMTVLMLQRVRALMRYRPVQTTVCFAGGELPLMRQLYGEAWYYQPQGQGDLGQRLRLAVDEVFGHARAVVVIGTDCPGLSGRILSDAFDALRTRDMVLGPATDGGYYLLGLRRPQPDVFLDIDWGSSRVLRQTILAATRLGNSILLLDLLSDVDVPEDLDVWRRYSGTPPV